jgi:trans-2,3-dihydro-3-hydroxyanthranilate isomerase
MLGLETGDLLGTSEKPQAVSCGLPFLIVPLTSVDALGRSRVKVDRWDETLAHAWASMIWVYAADPDGGAHHYRARMFAPGISVPEDPATGSAAAAFAGYLAERSRTRGGTLAWTIDQGVEMGRPSRLEIEADKADGAVTAIRVGGAAVLVSEGMLAI